MSDLVWSYSMLDMFEQCPLKWYDKYILKNKEPSSPALEKGNFFHKSIEDYLTKGKELPEELDRNAALIGSIKSKFVEQSKAELKMGVTNVLAPCEFFDKPVWGRSAADVVIMHHSSDSAFIGDWKTGKKYDKEDQLKILAMFLFKHYGKLQTITACNLWLKDNTMGEPYKFHRRNETSMWVELVKRLKKMYDAQGTPAATQTNPGFICNYCPVKSCKFNKSKE